MSGVEDYEAEYFLPTVRDVLDPLFGVRGLSYAGDYRNVTAYWRAGDTYVRVGYLPETLPKYELQIAMGVSLDGSLGPKLVEDSIAAWRILPPAIAPTIADWRFESEASLTAELRRAWEEVIDPYVLPLVQDEERLVQAIRAQREELAREDERLMNERLLAHARAEFDAGRFAEATHAYNEFGEARLSRVDRKRLDLARRRA